MTVKMNLFDTTVQELKRKLDEQPNKETVTIQRAMLVYLLENIDKIKATKEEK